MKDPTTNAKAQIVSDVIRDGLGVELLLDGDRVVAEVFRCDADHTVSVSLFVEAVPLRALQFLLDRANVELDPFEDGTPLSSAQGHE